jgi:HD superfamily phosphohydrolase
MKTQENPGRPIYLTDPVYGEFCIAEPLLIDLYNSKAVQRLKSIHQGGITAYIKPERKTTRLEHSIGVMALLRKLQADIKEQAAGLIHDVAHTAFSHVIDFVFPNSEHDYHEKHSTKQISRSDLPEILQKHKLNWHNLIDSSHYSLLEQPLPRLCADRLDYFLRDGVVDVGTFTAQEARSFLDHVHIWQGEIIVNDVDAARWLGEQFINLDQVCWCSVQEVGWYAVMARALQLALNKHIISEADFSLTDEEVLTALKRANDLDIDSWLKLLRTDVDFVRVDDAPDLTSLPKVRAVDPPVLIKNKVSMLSEIDESFANYKEQYIQSKKGIWYLRIIDPAQSPLNV